MLVGIAGVNYSGVKLVLEFWCKIGFKAPKISIWWTLVGGTLVLVGIEMVTKEGRW